jgi:hypothetical protein
MNGNGDFWSGSLPVVQGAKFVDGARHHWKCVAVEHNRNIHNVGFLYLAIHCQRRYAFRQRERWYYREVLQNRSGNGQEILNPV